MKTKFTAVAVATLAVGLAYAQEVRTPPTPEDIQARREARIRRQGGLVSAPLTNGTIVVINRQHVLEKAYLESVVGDVSKSLGFIVRLADAETEVPKGSVRFELVESLDDPTILVAPEDKWGRLNVMRLTADAPTRLRLETRFVKELWRVMAMTMGAANSDFKPSVLGPVFSLDDLDGNPALVVCPAAHGKMQMTAFRLNLARPHVVSYLRACREGWAPAPTNDIQKAIWDKVHQMPIEPLKIKPETKKVSD